MKLCFIVNQMYKAGGIERTLYYRLKELCKFYDIYLITLENGDNSFYFGDLGGVKHIDLNLNFERKINGGLKISIKNFIKTIFAFFKMQYILFKIRPKFTINVIGTHSFYFLPFLYYHGVLVLEHHASLYQLPPSKSKKYIMNKFDHHIFLTEEEANLANFLNNKNVIPNPIQNYNLKNIEYFNKKNRIISAGRIVDVKGFERLVRAWEIIHTEFPDWIVEIYGEPDQDVLNRINKIISKLKLENRIFIKSAIPNILEVLNDSKIYAMTSHFECFPMVLLEAMSVGALVVAFDCPTGPRNIINDQCGYLVENDNIDLFSQSLKEAIIQENSSNLLVINAYKKSQDFLLDNITDKWKTFFSETH